MRNTFDISFYCRKSKVNKKGLAPIELSVSLNGKRKFINLPMTMEPRMFEKQIYAKTENDTKKYLAEVDGKPESTSIRDRLNLSQPKSGKDTLANKESPR